MPARAATGQTTTAMTDERKKAHAGVWRRAHEDDRILNLSQLAAVIDQPVDYVVWALGDSKGRVSAMLKGRRRQAGVVPRRLPWRDHRARSRVKAKQFKGGEWVGSRDAAASQSQQLEALSEDIFGDG